MWVARNKDGSISAYNIEPIRDEKYGVFEIYPEYTGDDSIALNVDEFPEVTFENSPMEINSLQSIIISQCDRVLAPIDAAYVSASDSAQKEAYAKAFNLVKDAFKEMYDEFCKNVQDND